ncbi:unnamed protein product [Blepharisma stoltei]|uniref:Nudix hydrolase domain-containing protein n=1 Tax=Blepharisma stoltei TaxID=1481888 RepID=A0AAU9IKZ8_9CILI|nr:unnamed protein product [Blepharisma stoltei]
MDSNHMFAGVGIFVINKQDQILVGRRKDYNDFGLPGGKLEYLESVEEAALRELEEETGLKSSIEDIKVFKVANLVARKQSHAVSFYAALQIPENQTPENLEPHKSEDWMWVTWEEMMKLDLFYPLQVGLRSISPLKYDDIPALPSILIKEN